MTDEEKHNSEQVTNIQKILYLLGIPLTPESLDLIPYIMKKYTIKEKQCFCAVHKHNLIIKGQHKMEFDANGDCKECGLKNHKLFSY